jgi:hypothetical protein
LALSQHDEVYPYYEQEPLEMPLELSSSIDPYKINGILNAWFSAKDWDRHHYPGEKTLMESFEEA